MSYTIERRFVEKTDATIPAASGAGQVASVAKHKVRVEPETTKVETEDDMLLADTARNISPSKETSFADRHNVVSSQDKNIVTAAGNTPHKGPFWTGRQGATAKQSYINTDGLAKK
ncbi:MAG: hypothetical protein ACMZI0_03640 [Symbiopectobacterium sp.]|uniref:hypothetical protein n=1 Tax=Symbiopectobacterium sp. TaxID=2952789 RepID=UPI0039E9999E